MKISIVARIFTGLLIVICIIRCIIAGISTLINGFTTHNIISNVIGAISAGIVIVSSLVLFAGIIITAVRFTINVFIWTLTGKWNKNWFFEFD